MSETILVCTYRDYDTQDIKGVFLCDYELTETDWIVFAESQEDIRLKVRQGYEKKACARCGIPYIGTIHLTKDAPEQIEYEVWEGKQESIFAMFKGIHNLKEVNWVEVTDESF